MRLMWILFIIQSWFLGAAVAQTDDNCPPARLSLGDRAFVTTSTPLIVRDAPSGARSDFLDEWTPVTLLEGPICADGLQRWRVQVGHMEGWVAEGDATDAWLQAATQPEDGRITPESFYGLSVTQTRAGEGNASQDFDHNANWLALVDGYPANRVHVWDTSGEGFVIDPDFADGIIVDHVALGGDTLALSGGLGEGIQLWDLPTQTLLAEIDTFAYDLGFAQETLIVLALNEIILFEDAQPTLRLTTPTADRLAIAPNGATFAAVNLDRTLDVWTRDGERLAQLDPPGSGVYAAHFTNDSGALVYAYCREAVLDKSLLCIHHKLAVWDLASQTERLVIDLVNYEPIETSLNLTTTPQDDLLLVSRPWGCGVWAFRLDDGAQVGYWANVLARGAGFSADGTQLLILGGDPEINIWQLSTAP